MYVYNIYISLYINYISINIYRYICELVGYVHLKMTLLDTGMK